MRPPAEWEDLATVGSAAVRRSQEAEADAAAVRAARFAAYQGARLMGLDHRKAVRRSNAAAVKVARVLGFAYPKAHGTLTF